MTALMPLMPCDMVLSATVAFAVALPLMAALGIFSLMVAVETSELMGLIKR